MDAKKQEIAKEALKALGEIEDTVRMENLVKDNKIEFKIDDKLYRIRKPNFVERQEIDIIRRKRYLEMITDETYLFKKQWVEKYKAKGVNLSEKENRISALQIEIKDTLLRLATAEIATDVDQLKKDVLRFRDEQIKLSMEIAELLSYSIEDQMLVYVNGYTTYLVLEVKEEQDWKRLYDTYEAFKKSESPVINQAFYYMSYLIYQHQEEEAK